jgi:predicted ArsR family transcriptional regulator
MTKTTEPAPPHVTKTAKLLTLLQTGTGASLEDMTDATGWQPHTVRAAMTGLKKKGHVINKHVEGKTTIWSVKVAAS